MKTTREMVERYSQEHPEAKDGVIRASYAYHSINNTGDHKWPRFPHVDYHTGYNIFQDNELDPFSHLRDDQCMVCGRTRREVRWDSNPPECAGWKPTDIEGTILNEEKSFIDLLEKSGPLIKKVIKKRGLSGGTLSFLHHTHGIDIEVVEHHVELTNELRSDYDVEWEKHCMTGGKFK